ncbi:MAG: flavin reductase family protein [Pseudomonadota bacterium]
MSAAISPDDFRKASGLWATGVSIVTTIDTEATPYGLTMNSVTSLSLDPPLYIVNLDKGSDTLITLEASGAFCINVLSDQQQELSNRFAKKGGNKFEDVAYSPGFRDVPCLTGALMSIQCEVHDIHDGGDHKIVVGKVAAITHLDPETTQPLLFYRGRYVDIKT